jgi:hypothetical protein
MLAPPVTGAEYHHQKIRSKRSMNLSAEVAFWVVTSLHIEDNNQHESF